MMKKADRDCVKKGEGRNERTKLRGKSVGEIMVPQKLSMLPNTVDGVFFGSSQLRMLYL